MTFADPKPLNVCFSYAAYAKSLIHRLSCANIPVGVGLSDAEFSALELCYKFTFPPDLRSILQEGLPVGPGFPNWRSSSKQQLRIIANLPIMGICKEVSRNEFWLDSWGARPDEGDRRVDLAKGFLEKAPTLVPIYRHFYIPSSPCMAGNPVFYVHGANVKLTSFDLVGFFQQIEFRMSGPEEVKKRPKLYDLFTAPAWAATEARRIEFWSDLTESVPGKAAQRHVCQERCRGELGGFLEKVRWKLMDGGWNEEEVSEMMTVNGGDEQIMNRDDNEDSFEDGESVGWRVGVLSMIMLRAGWSPEDVAALGFPVGDGESEELVIDDDSCFEFATQKGLTC